VARRPDFRQECDFKDFKCGGFGWQHEKRQDAGRVERLWLAMAVAMVCVVSLDTQAKGPSINKVIIDIESDAVILFRLFPERP
jgi:hypothetical protein